MVLAWLVYSVIRKLLGLAILAVVVGGGFILWTNPEMANSLTGMVLGFLGRG